MGLAARQEGFSGMDMDWWGVGVGNTPSSALPPLVDERIVDDCRRMVIIRMSLLMRMVVQISIVIKSDNNNDTNNYIFGCPFIKVMIIVRMEMVIIITITINIIVSLF